MLIICLRFNVFTNLEEKVAQLRGIEDTNLTKIPLLNLAISYNQHVVEFEIHRILMNYLEKQAKKTNFKFKTLSSEF